LFPLLDLDHGFDVPRLRADTPVPQRANVVERA